MAGTRRTATTPTSQRGSVHSGPTWTAPSSPVRATSEGRFHPSARERGVGAVQCLGHEALAGNVVELVNVLHDQGEQVLLLGGPSDKSLLDNIANRAQKTPEVVAGQLDLLGSAALMSNAKAVVSNDSAPLHMAGAVGTPVVGVFCSTTSRFGFGALPGDVASGKGKNVELE